jgi:carboxyl-terminal processing protease
MRRTWQSIIVAGLLTGAGLLAACASGTHTEPAQATIPYDHDLGVASFEQVWTTVRDKHWDPALGGLDWNKVHDELRPRIESATTMAEARVVMDDMLDRLGQSHFGIWPQEIYLSQQGKGTKAASSPAGAGGDAPGAEGSAAAAKTPEDDGGDDTPGEGYAGIEVRALGDDAVVTRVAPGSPADTAGVKTGWLVTKVWDRKVAAIASHADDAGAGHVSRNVKLNAMFQRLFSGDVGEQISATFVDGAGASVTREFTLGKVQGTPATLGNLPTFFLEIDRRRLPENIEYFGFNIFMDPPRLMGEFQKSVESARDARGFVIDLRGNPGGIGGLAMGIGGWFTTSPNTKLGTMITRSGTLNFVLNPRVHAYQGPVAILVDCLSGSTSEILAGGMKDLGRARVFGQRSAGAALPSVFDKLPNGDRFQYAIANYISAGGKPLEGNGVEPDEEVTLDRASLLAGRDPVLDAAVRWITLQPATNPASAGTP